MATLTVPKTWEIDGVLTDPTSITLGITRDDSHTAVLPPGTPMERASTGVYRYTLQNVDGSTTYTASVAVVWGGSTYRFDFAVAPEVVSASVAYPDGLPVVLRQLQALLLQVTIAPKPTYSVHGHSYSWNEFQEMLTRQIEQVTKLYSQANPFEILSRG